MDSARVIYRKDKAGEWRWRLQATNGWAGREFEWGEGYKNRGDCVNGFHRLCDLIGGNPSMVEVEFEDDTESE